jgi:hypothetical protein
MNVIDAAGLETFGCINELTLRSAAAQCSDGQQYPTFDRIWHAEGKLVRVLKRCRDNVLTSIESRLQAPGPRHLAQCPATSLRCLSNHGSLVITGRRPAGDEPGECAA